MVQTQRHRHRHRHRHLSAVVLPDGRRLTAVSFDPADPYSRVRSPDYGLYFDSRWQPPWDLVHPVSAAPFDVARAV